MKQLNWIACQALSAALYVAAFGYGSKGALNVLTGFIVVTFVLVLLATGQKMTKEPRSVPAWLSSTAMSAYIGTLFWFDHPWLAAMQAFNALVIGSTLTDTPKEAA